MNKKEIEQTFLKLIEYTYIYGYEDYVKENILPNNLKKDQFGNYYIKIGESKTLFTSHLDTVGKQKLKVNYEIYEKDGHRFVKTDGNTILGADDKAGVTIMLNMIDNNVPGLYYFLIGEETGGAGSRLLAKYMFNMLSNYDRVISFDRRGYGSIINRQVGKWCCSNDFVNGLSEEFKKNGMEFKADPYGVRTDSAYFMAIIPECTNLSVGYFNEHKVTEEQDLDYLLELCNVCTKINWESLPVVREPENFDSTEPEYVQKVTDLPMYKLFNIFDEVYDIIYEEVKFLCANDNFFKTEKEMIFYDKNDLEETLNFIAIVHSDGSITLKKNDIKIKIKNIDSLKKNKKRLKSILSFSHNLYIDEKSINYN